MPKKAKYWWAVGSFVDAYGTVRPRIARFTSPHRRDVWLGSAPDGLSRRAVASDFPSAKQIRRLLSKGTPERGIHPPFATNPED